MNYICRMHILKSPQNLHILMEKSHFYLFIYGLQYVLFRIKEKKIGHTIEEREKQREGEGEREEISLT